MATTPKKLELHDEYEYGFNDGDVGVLKFQRGLTREVVEEISRIKQEPAWMRDFRLHALDVFLKKPMPTWDRNERAAPRPMAPAMWGVPPSKRSGGSLKVECSRSTCSIISPPK